MAPMKSPGPDGLPVGFYIDNLSALGKEVLDVVLQIFQNRWLIMKI
jgi:hypothetical protein